MPTATTLGNTLRVITYIRCIMNKANITEDQCQPMVSGDDVLVIIRRQRLMDFIRTMPIYYSM